jgi:hypothetical protein
VNSISVEIATIPITVEDAQVGCIGATCKACRGESY